MNIFEERGTRHRQNDVFLRKFLLLLATLTTITPKQEIILIQQHQQHFLVNNLRLNQLPEALKKNFKIVYTSLIICMINIRKATKEDVAYIAEGIYHAFLLEDKALYNQWIRTLKEVCAQEDTHYSYKNTWIAEVDRKIAEADGERVEVDRERAGMMIAVDGEHYREQRDRMYPQLKGLFDIAFGEGWDDMEDEAKAGEFYIDSLAVSLPYRNQGVGTALIEKAKEMAKEQGIGVVTLAVEPTNPAKKLYRKLGFAYQRGIEIFNEEYELYAAEIVV